MVTWRTEQKKIPVPDGYIAIKCIDCKKVFVIRKDQPISEAVPNHVWCGVTMVRHLTKSDYLEEQAEKELCPKCGVPHGRNPTTGCGIGCVQKDKEEKQ